VCVLGGGGVDGHCCSAASPSAIASRFRGMPNAVTCHTKNTHTPHPHTPLCSVRARLLRGQLHRSVLHSLPRQRLLPGRRHGVRRPHHAWRRNTLRVQFGDPRRRGAGPQRVRGGGRVCADVAHCCHGLRCVHVQPCVQPAVQVPALPGRPCGGPCCSTDGRPARQQARRVQ
jgi:hypothetical protein